MEQQQPQNDERVRLSATRDSGSRDEGVVPAEVSAEIAQSQTGKGIMKFPSFVKACWAELKLVRWPDRAQVGQGTGIVLVFVLIAGLLLGATDKVAQELVDLII